MLSKSVSVEFSVAMLEAILYNFQIGNLTLKMDSTTQLTLTTMYYTRKLYNLFGGHSETFLNRKSDAENGCYTAENSNNTE